ncbi:hypothetical protein SISSUDRAFT_1101116 [Sistotremastrum suecicum HHB10207 ss-3]|uniref:Uncharacterized protein n=1 Tax=Sistotremastrum suecicum HHB10207 ss-3 TaxID=1314776 RepID=A0A165WV06_9AGAM|nr:hypothetical protein SISSUDRAFT_1101116 [Sistotremastrum suecicum HHB10207 ss-3]
MSTRRSRSEIKQIAIALAPHQATQTHTVPKFVVVGRNHYPSSRDVIVSACTVRSGIEVPRRAQFSPHSEHLKHLRDNPLHCQVAAPWNDRMWISSPNSSHIPLPPPTHGQLHISTDGGFGRSDFAHHPQLYDRQLPHLPFIPTSLASFPDFQEPLAMFEPLPEHQFQPSDSSTDAHRTGKPEPEFTELLARNVELMAHTMEDQIQAWRSNPQLTTVAIHARKLTALMKHCLHRLQTLYMSLLDARSTLRNCQRCWLELYALRLYMDSLATESTFGTRPGRLGEIGLPASTLGAFVDNEYDLHTLHRLGCPVWFIRPLADLADPPTIYASCITSIDAEPDIPTHVAHPSTQLPAEQRGAFILSGSLAVRAVRDAIHANAWEGGSLWDNPGSGANLDRLNGGNSSEATFISSPPVSLLPSPLPPWNQALVQLAHRMTLDDTDPKATYSVPHPSWFTAVNGDKQRRYFINWLTVRRAWLYRISTARARCLTPRMWKDFLSHGPERGPLDPAQNDLPKSIHRKPSRRAHVIRAGVRLSARQNTQKYFLQMIPNVLSIRESTSLRWFDAPLFSSDPAHDCLVRQQILAEICDIGFHLELETLDRTVAPDVPATQRQQRFSQLWESMGRDPRRGYHSPSTPALPSLGNPVWNLKVPVLEAVRQILSRWPNAPDILLRSVAEVGHQDADVKHVNQLHGELATFYVDTFTRNFRREPFIPIALSM